MKAALKFGVLFVAMTVALVGCGGKEKVAEPIQKMKAPEWVIKGSGAFGGDRGKVFYGVGSASMMRNRSLMRTAADNRARSELAKIFEFYTASLMKDYMASTVGGDPNLISEEQHVEQAIKTVTSTTLSGVEIVNHWEDERTGEFFSLARLDLGAFTDSLDKVRELDEKVKEHIKENAEKLHGELEKEEDKR